AGGGGRRDGGRGRGGGPPLGPGGVRGAAVGAGVGGHLGPAAVAGGGGGVDQHQPPLVSAGRGGHSSVRTIQHPAAKEEKVTQADEEARRRAERARQVALFRDQLIQEVIDSQLSARQRGRRGGERDAADTDAAGGGRARVSEQTIRRWVRWWRAGGFEALVPSPARVSPRTPAEVLALAVALKRENPERTAVQICRILR